MRQIQWVAAPTLGSHVQSAKTAVLATILQPPSFEHIKFEGPIEFANEKVQEEHDCVGLGLTKSLWLKRVWIMLLRSITQLLDYES